MLVWFFAGSVPVRFGLVWAFTGLEPAKRVHTKTLRCIANKYIYMHLAYAACARAKKKNFFVEFIELIRSFSKLFEFCKSDENRAQLLALKLYTFEAIHNLTFLMFSLAYLFFLACSLARTSRTSSCE